MDNTEHLLSSQPGSMMNISLASPWPEYSIRNTFPYYVDNKFRKTLGYFSP